MNTINLNLYNVLRKDLNLTEEKSQNVAKAIQNVMVESVIDKEVATKNFVRKEIAEIKTNMLKWFAGLVFIALALMIIGLYFRK